LFSGAHTFEINYLLVILMQWHARSDSQDIGLGNRMIAEIYTSKLTKDHPREIMR